MASTSRGRPTRQGVPPEEEDDDDDVVKEEAHEAMEDAVPPGADDFPPKY
jgi:hypothetical protein